MKTLITLSLVSIFLFSCISLEPKAAPNYDPKKISKVQEGSMSRSGGSNTYSAISPDIKLLAGTTMGGNIEISELGGKNEFVLYDRDKNNDFARMKTPADFMSTKKDPAYEKFANELSAMGGWVGLAAKLHKAGMGFSSMDVHDRAWSPDGKKLAVIAYRDVYKAILFVFDLETKEKYIVRKSFAPFRNPSHYRGIHTRAAPAAGVSWKSNETLVYSFFFHENYYVLEREHFAKPKEKLLSTNYAIRVYYSPDKKKIAFLKPSGKREPKQVGGLSSYENHFSRFNLYISDPDFKNRVLVAKNLSHNLAPSWSPNGEYLAYIKNGLGITDAFDGKLFYYNVKNKTHTEIIHGDYLNTPMFANNNEIYFAISENYIFKARIP